MRQLLFTILLCCTCAIASFGQPKPEDSTASNQKFYFPASLYSDPAALDKAIPSLAEKVINNFSADKKKNWQKQADYYALAHDFQSSLTAIDSLRKKDDDKSGEMALRSYDLAMIKDKEKPGSFDQVFKQEYSTEYNQLSFRKKVSAAFFDTSFITQAKKDYSDLTEKFKKGKTDSLTNEEAQSLLDKYSANSVYRKILPLMSTYTSDPKYQMMFPAIKGFKWGGVVPVQNVTELADPKMKYKLLMELTGFAAKGEEKTAKNEINYGIGEISRKINLHVAAGVPQKNIDLVIIVHAGALFAFLNNEKYKRKYGIDNPNINIIKDLQNFGAKIIVCGQAMTFLGLEMEDLVPGIKEAFSAQTVLSTYELRGYKFYNVTLD
jgi:intracellular sulfur oxidation DsrE/DsrF family protein